LIEEARSFLEQRIFSGEIRNVFLRADTGNNSNIRMILRDVGIQFRGLGYLDILAVSEGSEIWALTNKGKTQVALVLGRRRQLAAESEPGTGAKLLSKPMADA